MQSVSASIVVTAGLFTLVISVLTNLSSDTRTFVGGVACAVIAFGMMGWLWSIRRQA